MTNCNSTSCTLAVRQTKKTETDLSSYSGSDDDTVIESEQPLFLTGVPSVKTNNNDACYNQIDDIILGCDVGEVDSDMAELLGDTFETNAFNSKTGVVSNLEGFTNSNEMDELLMAENEALMLFPEL